MKLYFIRHAESVGNQMGVHQFDNTELSQLGVIQAHAVAKHLLLRDINSVVSSTMQRAKQTTEQIALTLKTQPMYTDLLREMRRPTVIQGKPVDDPVVVEIKNAMYKGAADPNFHYADEENFQEFRERCKQALDYLAKFDSEKTAVITHGYVIRMILLLTMLQDMNPSFIETMRTHWEVGPGSITVLEKKADAWQLLAWNDTSHMEFLPKGSVY